MSRYGAADMGWPLDKEGLAARMNLSDFYGLYRRLP